MVLWSKCVAEDLSWESTDSSLLVWKFWVRGRGKESEGRCDLFWGVVAANNWVVVACQVRTRRMPNLVLTLRLQ